MARCFIGAGQAVVARADLIAVCPAIPVGRKVAVPRWAIGGQCSGCGCSGCMGSRCQDGVGGREGGQAGGECGDTCDQGSIAVNELRQRRAVIGSSGFEVVEVPVKLVKGVRLDCCVKHFGVWAFHPVVVERPEERRRVLRARWAAQ